MSNFQGVSHLGEALASEHLEANLISWLDWSFLSIGGWQDATRGSGHAPARLYPVDDPYLTAGTAWQGLRSSWVWESGTGYGYEPIQVSGVWVTGGFVPTTGTGPYAHKVNYPEGKILFDSPIPTGLTVEVNHSYRSVQVRSAWEPWFQAVAFRSQDETDAQFASSKGAWSLMAQNRVQLPAIVVEVLPETRLRSYEAGNAQAQIRTQYVNFHVMSETPWEAAKLHDVLIAQKDATLATFDRNTAAMPLDANGSKVSGAATHSRLTEDYPYLPFHLSEMSSDDHGRIGNHVWWCTVRTGVRIDGPVA